MRREVMDPLRRKLVPLTPEESVRQWLIGVLEAEMKVPRTVMMSEVSLVYGEAAKPFRADIVVYDRSAKPLLIAECKRPEVSLSEGTALQALMYSAVLEAPFLLLSNGIKTVILRKEGGEYKPMAAAPDYEQMLSYAD